MDKQAVIKFNKPFYGSSETEIKRCLQRSDNTGDSQFIRESENQIELLLKPDALKDGGSASFFLTNSGTSALEVAARACDIGPGDEFIVSSYTFVSSASAFALTGASPIFVDVELQSLAIDIDKIESLISERTKVIVLTHYGGQALNFEKLRALSARYNLIIVEDAAHGFLCKQNGSYLGTIGDFGCFSFHDSKVFSAGEGGAIIVNNEKFLKATQEIIDKGTNRRDFQNGLVDKFSWVSKGMGVKPNSFGVSVLMAQIREADEIYRKRNLIFQRYKKASAGLLENGWKTINENRKDSNFFHIYWMLAPSAGVLKNFESQMQELRIETKRHYPALQRSPFAINNGFKGVEDCPNAIVVADTLIRLPLYAEMKDQEIERVCAALEIAADRF